MAKKNKAPQQQKKSKGRPKLPDGKFRVSYGLKVSPEEKELLERAAKALGQPSRLWCRETLLAQARKVLGE